MPRRARVIGAKAVATVLVGIASMVLALAVGAVGNVVGTTLAGTDLVWDISLAQMGGIVLANVLGMLVGFMLGTTATALASMRAIVERFGPAPRAFLVVPIVGACFIDFVNALLISFCLNLFS